MFKLKFFVFFVFIVLLNSCSKDVVKKNLIKEKSLELQVIEAYQEGVEALEAGDVLFAAKKFNEAEILFPQGDWAPKSALMASYSYYLQNYYSEALSNLNRYLKTYPNDKNLPYAQYLIGISYYEMIEDEKRDIKPLLKAKEKFNLIIKKYPNTDFALDAKFKLDLIEDILASKEIYLARHYQKKNKWIAAINRYKNIIENYDRTIYVEEALHRLVEINYKIGLIDESKKYANLLGYNYQSGEWYKKSYKVFNRNYKEVDPKKLKKNKKGVIDKFKKLFD